MLRRHSLLPWFAASDLMESPIDVSIAVISELAPLARAVTRAAPPATFASASGSIDMNGSGATVFLEFDMGMSLW